jgi:hypothetical protein
MLNCACIETISGGKAGMNHAVHPGWWMETTLLTVVKCCVRLCNQDMVNDEISTFSSV